MSEKGRLSEEEVKHIAQLARIELTQEESERFAKEISDILGYVEQLQEVDTDEVEPITQVNGKKNVFRDDVAIPCSDETRDMMAKNYPLSQDGYIRVKQILK
jgi:aspartyl-tRNA(Asn)/glutamyl-tRNA(Gln) amidotransferase subunit C